MPPRRDNPFSSFADQNSFLGQPLLPRIGQAISDIGRTAIAAVTPPVNTPPPTLAGVSIPPAGASASSVNPLPLLASLNPFGNRPLIRTDFGERPATPSQAVPQLPSGATSYGVSFNMLKESGQAQSRLRQAMSPNPFISDASGGMNMGFNYRVEDTDMWRGMIGYNPSTSGIRGLRKFDPLYSYSPNQYPERSQLASSSAVSPQQSASAPIPVAPQPTLTPTGQQRSDTAVRYGTISATPQQLENLNARDTAYVSRTPAEQQALIAQMRERGAALAAQRTQTMQNFAQSRIPEAARVNLATPQGRFGQPLTNLFPQRTQFAALPQSRGAIGATGFGEMQRQQAESATAALRPSPLYAGLGIGGIGGGPQPAQPMVANNNLAERQRRRLFGTV